MGDRTGSKGRPKTTTASAVARLSVVGRPFARRSPRRRRQRRTWGGVRRDARAISASVAPAWASLAQRMVSRHLGQGMAVLAAHDGRDARSDGIGRNQWVPDRERLALVVEIDSRALRLAHLVRHDGEACFGHRGGHVAPPCHCGARRGRRLLFDEAVIEPDGRVEATLCDSPFSPVATRIGSANAMPQIFVSLLSLLF